MAAWHWIALGVVLALAEIKVPGVTLIWVGAAALFVGLAMNFWPAMGWQSQVLLFLAMAALLVGAALYMRSRRPPKPDPAHDLNVGTARFVGERGALETPIVNGHGEVRLGDTVWPCRGPDLPAGATVKVVSTDGTVLAVEAAT